MKMHKLQTHAKWRSRRCPIADCLQANRVFLKAAMLNKHLYAKQKDYIQGLKVIGERKIYAPQGVP